MPIALRPRARTRLPLAGVAFLALADTAIVALALPPILSSSTRTSRAWRRCWACMRWCWRRAAARRAARPAVRHPRARPGRGGLFAAGSLVCGLAGGIELLLIARAVQALGGAALLVTAHAVLVGDRPERDWTEPRPLAPGGAARHGRRARHRRRAHPGVRLAVDLPDPGARRARRGARMPHGARRAVPRRACAARRWPAVSPRWRSSSGAIAAALFLTVLLLISGWSIEPLAAALVVSVMPVSALAAARIGGPAGTRAVARRAAGRGRRGGARVPPHRVGRLDDPAPGRVGIGMGLSLTALSGELLPDRDGHESALLLTVRHLGSRSPC